MSRTLVSVQMFGLKLKLNLYLIKCFVFLNWGVGSKGCAMNQY